MNNEKTKVANKIYRLAKETREIYSALYALRNEAELKPFLEATEDCVRKLVEVESDLCQVGNGIY